MLATARPSCYFCSNAKYSTLLALNTALSEQHTKVLIAYAVLVRKKTKLNSVD